MSDTDLEAFPHVTMDEVLWPLCNIELLTKEVYAKNVGGLTIMNKKVIFIMMVIFLFSFFTIDALAIEVIPLQFSYPPIELGQVHLLPNGFYLLEYFRLDTSEFWHNMGRDDIRRHETEIFSSSGKSIFCCTEGEDIFPEKVDDYLFQYAVYPDSFLREMYWDGSMQNYFSNTWSFDGTIVTASSDPIHQDEENARYIESHYPYTIELYPYVANYERSAILTYVIDGSHVLLPFGYGERSADVSDSGEYCMVYDNISNDGKIHFLHYDPQRKSLEDYSTSLSTAAGELAILSDKIYMLTSEYSEEGYSYTLYSSSFPCRNADVVDFAVAAQFQLKPTAVVDDIIFTDDQLLLLVSTFSTDNFSYTSLNILSENIKIAPIYTWDHEAQYLGKTNAGDIQFITLNESSAGCQIMLFSNEDIDHFLTYLDQAQ